MAVRYLLDTNTVSYIIKGNFPHVRERLLKVPISEVGISVITEAELRFGVARLPQATKLAMWSRNSCYASKCFRGIRKQPGTTPAFARCSKNTENRSATSTS